MWVVLVGNLDALNGLLGVADLPDEKASDEQEKDDWQQHRLQKNAVELIEIHAVVASMGKLRIANS